MHRLSFMHSIAARCAVAAVILLACLQLVYIWHSRREQKHTSNQSAYKQIHSAWEYDWTRDRNDYGLSTAQCDTAFPHLYSEIDRAVARWQDRSMTPDAVQFSPNNEGGVRVLIYDDKVRILQTKGMVRVDFRARIQAVLQSIHRAISSVDAIGEKFTDTEFRVVVDDFATLDSDSNRTAFSFSRRIGNLAHDDLWIMPDFHFGTAPSEPLDFSEIQRMAREHDSPLADKKPQVFWRGVEWTAPKIRGSLLQVTQDQPWANVEVMSWRNKASIVPLEESCDYRFLVNTEGRSYSSRLIFILNCDSVPIIHDAHWIMHFSHLLEPDVHYIRVDRDFSNLPSEIERYNTDLEAAQRIADNARGTLRERYTTPAAEACYWRKLLRTWASVAFVPRVYGGDEKRLRGIELDEFLWSIVSKDGLFRGAEVMEVATIIIPAGGITPLRK